MADHSTNELAHLPRDMPTSGVSNGTSDPDDLDDETDSRPPAEALDSLWELDQQRLAKETLAEWWERITEGRDSTAVDAALDTLAQVTGSRVRLLERLSVIESVGWPYIRFSRQRLTAYITAAHRFADESEEFDLSQLFQGLPLDRKTMGFAAAVRRRAQDCEELRSTVGKGENPPLKRETQALTRWVMPKVRARGRVGKRHAEAALSTLIGFVTGRGRTAGAQRMENWRETQKAGPKPAPSKRKTRKSRPSGGRWLADPRGKGNPARNLSEQKAFEAGLRMPRRRR